uniref:Uncharacterized protein n=1 Tax=Callorhinchus milii TaxID=7868 RepID=A0A4W3I5P0_CALMI
MKNVSLLPVTLVLSMNGPFVFMPDSEEDEEVTSKTIGLDVGQDVKLLIQFDPTFKDDLHTRIIEESLTIRYLEHPHVDLVELRGAVHFPNLQFETMLVDFGCILNDTEMVHYMTMTNNSPLLVKYNWKFLVDNWEYTISFSDVKMTSVSQAFDFADTDSCSSELQILNKETNRDAVSSPNENENEKIDAENERREGVGSPKDSFQRLNSTPTREEVKQPHPTVTYTYT